MDFELPPAERDAFFIRRSFRLPRQDTAYLRFLVEGYDGVLFMRSLDGRAALVEISYAPSCRSEAEMLLEALARETGLVEDPAGAAVDPL